MRKRQQMFALFCCVMLLLAALPSAAFAATAANTLIAQMTYTGGTAGTDVAGDKTAGYPLSLGDATIHASVNGTDARKLEWTSDAYVNGDASAVQPTMTAGNNNPWGSGAYIEVRLSTVGYSDIRFSAKLGGTKKGPRDFALQYSTDGVNFTAVAGATYSITTNKTMQQAFHNVALPAAAAGAKTLYVRMAVTSDTLINGNTGLVGATGGETAVNDIVITGAGEVRFFAQGDVDRDGNINTADARNVLQNTIGTVTFDEQQMQLADVDFSGDITTADARNVLIASLGGDTPVYVVAHNGGANAPTSGNVITLLGTTASVEGTGASVSGDTVTITDAGDYTITGTMTNGRVVVAADETNDNVTLYLDNASITCTYTSPLFVQSADNVDIILCDGTTNTLTDSASYTDTTSNAALAAKCDMDIDGTGALVVNGNYHNGIDTNDDLKIKNGKITVKAVNHALKGNDSITVNGGTLTLTAGADGMQADNTSDTTKGYITINDGTIDITAANDAVQAETALVVNGGTITAKTGGGSTSSPSSSDTNSYKGLKGTGSVTVTGGVITLDCKDDTVHSNADVLLAGGTLDCSSGDDGIHADGTLTIEDPTALTVRKSYEAFEGVNMVVKGGTSRFTASDDGVNAAGGTDDNSGYWYVQNNLLYVVSSTTAGYTLKLNTNLTFDVNTQTYLVTDLNSTTPYDIVLDIDSKAGAGSPAFSTDWYSGLGATASDVASGYMPATNASKTAALDMKGYFDWNGVPSDGKATVQNVWIKLSGKGNICLGALQLSNNDGIASCGIAATGSVIEATAAPDANVLNLLEGTASCATSTGSSSSTGGMMGETVGSLTMTGGYMAVYAGGDGIDVNGNAVITGGTLIVHGPTDSGNGALDYDGTFVVNGGLLIAAGSSGMLQTPGTSSTQYTLSVKSSASRSGGTAFGILDASGNTIVAFKPSKTYQAVVVCAPTITKSTTYTAYYGGSCSGNETDGLYDGKYTAGTSIGSATVSSIVTSIGSSSSGGGTRPSRP